MKVYLICDTYSTRMNITKGRDGKLDYWGLCSGRIVQEDKTVIGEHTSSSFSYLRTDLLAKLPAGDYEVIDLIGQPCPAHFLHPEVTGQCSRCQCFLVGNKPHNGARPLCPDCSIELANDVWDRRNGY